MSELVSEVSRTVHQHASVSDTLSDGSDTHASVSDTHACPCPAHPLAQPRLMRFFYLLRREKDFFIDNLLVRIHIIIEMIWWTGLAPWVFEFIFSR